MERAYRRRITACKFCKVDWPAAKKTAQADSIAPAARSLKPDRFRAL
jgi:hypothetical protein